MSENMELQLEKVNKKLPQLFLSDAGSLLRKMGIPERKIISPGCDAVWSMHDIARHLLQLPDEDVSLDWEYGGVRIDESLLPEPKIAAKEPIYEAGEDWVRIGPSRISYRPFRVPFSGA
jgi:hypothetical protein